MNFLYPQFLFALFTVLIPVIIHLFNFQKNKRVQFSNVAFLKEVKQSTKAKSTIKHWLILITRILAITAIVLAFAQPFIPIKDQNNNATVLPSSIFIDNSFSSQNRSTEGLISDISRELSFQLIDKLPNHINHQFLTNNFTSSEQHLYPTSELIRKNNSIATSSKSQVLSTVIKRQKSAFSDSKFNSYLISDFQKTQFDFSKIVNDTNLNFTLIPIQPNKTSNVSVDSIWFENPVHRLNSSEEVHFRLRNYGSETQESVRTTMNLNDKQVAFSNLTIPAESYIDTFFVFYNELTGPLMGEIKVNDFPITFDNSFYFSFNVKSSIQVSVISSGSATTNVKEAFSTEPYFSYSEMDESNVDFQKLSYSDIIILNELENFSSGMNSSIYKFVESGGSLVVIPSPNSNQSNLNQLLSSLSVSQLGSINKDSSRVNYLNQESYLYQKVFIKNNAKVNLPSIYAHFEFSKTNTTNETVLLKTNSNNRILSSWNSGKGNVYLFAIPLQPEFSNFRVHSIFLPSLFQMAFLSSVSAPEYLTIGKDEFIDLKQNGNNNEVMYQVSQPEKNVSFIPEIHPLTNGVKLGFHNQVSTSGTYLLQSKDSLISYLSFNYSRVESNVNSYTETELDSIIKTLNLTNFSILKGEISNFSERFETRNSGIELWRWFILAALLFLGMEILLIRFFKPTIL